LRFSIRCAIRRRCRLNKTRSKSKAATEWLRARGLAVNPFQVDDPRIVSVVITDFSVS
jgi:hypothetical protein